MIPNAERSSRLIIALLLSVASAVNAAAKDYGQYSNVDPAIREWIEGLKDKTGLGCCATADGHPAEYARLCDSLVLVVPGHRRRKNLSHKMFPAWRGRLRRTGQFACSLTKRR